jgi:phosphate/sulfate permease
MTLAIIITVGLLLAFGNGANDNFKGVATLPMAALLAGGYSLLLAKHI